MLHKELMADNRHVCKNGHLCKDLIKEEADCMASNCTDTCKKTNFCFTRGEAFDGVSVL